MGSSRDVSSSGSISGKRRRSSRTRSASSKSSGVKKATGKSRTHDAEPRGDKDRISGKLHDAQRYFDEVGQPFLKGQWDTIQKVKSGINTARTLYKYYQKAQTLATAAQSGQYPSLRRNGAGHKAGALETRGEPSVADVLWALQKTNARLDRIDAYLGFMTDEPRVNLPVQNETGPARVTAWVFPACPKDVQYSSIWECREKGCFLACRECKHGLLSPAEGHHVCTDCRRREAIKGDRHLTTREKRKRSMVEYQGDSEVSLRSGSSKKSRRRSSHDNGPGSAHRQPHVERAGPVRIRDAWLTKEGKDRLLRKYNF
ncbi:Uu.00g106450.m01.CDS01 [Anthostomella pinea]|uniref:Uu.00g106450.m01.CDS01 n=1 Tax=Anthostomella pinea TaxID=933095 RepID=A0AAI8YDG9_9PEZI|nr:Uu.00g106450.m01.CDS01 [Anthostomella pinea]